MQSEVEKVVILGGGTAGWMAAAAMAKFLGTARYSFTVVESDDIGTVGVGEATIPSFLDFNRALGLNEFDLVKATQATFKLGIEFSNWRAVGDRYFHPFGLLGPPQGGLQFQHYWRRWAEAKGETDWGLLNAETLAARSLKFDSFDPQPPGRLPALRYAYQLDASLYGKYLRRLSESMGVLRKEGTVTTVHQNGEGGEILALELQSGERVEGDLFIDCTGFRGLLTGGTLGTPYIDWSHWLPMDRAVAVPSERSGPLLPYTRATAHDAGWQWRIPLQHRTGNGHVYASQFTDEETATDTLLKHLDGPVLAPPRHLKFKTGVRERIWNKNCVAIGLSSGFLEPLESTSIHLIQVAITKLLKYFPLQGTTPLLRNRYNREMRAEYDLIKDFLITHYHVTDREDTPFWRYVRHYEIPDSLKDRLALYRERGEVAIEEGELFKEVSWFYILSGQGMRNVGTHPGALSASMGDLDGFLEAVKRAMAQRVASLPLHEDFIARHCAAPQM